jgi:hypothetical protein
MKFKLSDFKQATEFVGKNCNDEDISITFDSQMSACKISFYDADDNEIVVEVYDTDKNKHVTVQSRKWLPK